MAALGNGYSDDHFSDDESASFTHARFGGSQRTIQETKGWNVFQDPPIKKESGSMANQQCLELTVKIVKLLAYIITFVIVLASGVISKGTLLFMTSQLSPKKVLSYCNRDYGRDKQFIVRLPEAERVAWMWCLMFAFMVPEVGTLFRSLRICYFKSWKKPPFVHFLIVWLAETMHTIGLALLVYSVLPDMDVVKGAMLTNCVCFVPAVMGLLSRSNKDSKRFIKVIIDMVAIVAQATGFVVWPLVEGNAKLWLTPIAIFLISAGWWENFVSEESPLPFIKILGKMKQDLNQTRYYMYVFISIWKMLCFFCATCVIIWIQEESVSHFFTEFSNGFGAHNITIKEIKPVLGGPSLPDITELIPTGADERVLAHDMTPIYVLLINVFATYFVYIFGKFACKIMIQGFSYAFPVNLTVPVSISLLITLCGLRNGDPCFFYDIFPGYLFFQSPSIYFLNDFISIQYAWIWLLWLLSQTWITLHIWTPQCKRLASTEKLFVSPLYNSFLIDQSMALNRRRDDQADAKTEDLDEIQKEKDEDNHATRSNVTGVSGPTNNVKSSDSITRIYVCATMWHETKDEMIEFLKSIMRMDEDQCARRNAQKHLRVVDPDYYELETHIFFDDAFEISDHSDDDRQLNRFVKLLVNTMDDAATEVHQTHMHIRAPIKYPAAYGGRLVWTLPGKTKMIAHLKDKSKIRPKKRWSQVMYMYYLLGHRLMELDIPVDRKDVIAENTFLLALDGDIDFHPHAVQLLVDLMKRNKGLGAACGRIHPVGTGPMVWYQLFEYAIGHWLQKATEHMIGCVLCSPGCFSLFRAKALMADNVMKKYTTTSKEPKHYVQYDQGEDRWLCTLILQQGYRVEYSAASDAYTHCPEGFNEFYNQRRRWVPSTIANILDLLNDAKRTIKMNDNISRLYIAYQILIMAGTILGPGTIFLMLVGAFVAAFQIDNWTSFIYNLIPILVFMFVCFTCKSEIQLKIAALISAIYGLIMMAVLVGIMLQINNDGILAPSSLFLFLVAGEMIVTALLHPQELYCLPCGVVYYVTVPSMYLLLILYSIFNMNVISWGTREVATKKTKEELEKDKKDAEEAQKKVKQKSLLGFLQGGGGTDNDDEGSIELSLAGLFKCMLCTHKKNDDDKIQLMHIAESLEAIKKQLGPNAPMSRRRSFSITSREHSLDKVQEEPIEEDIETTVSDSGTISIAPKDERDDLVNPYWIEDPDLRKGEVDYLSSAESKFWKDMLDEYLYPIDENKEEQARVAKELKDLRDQCVFAFFMINALFVLIVFLLTLKKDLLHINWPFGVKTNITYVESLQEVHISKEYLQLEPIGLVFVFFFALIMVIQFIAMLFHRFGTLSHILASTDLNFYCTKKAKDLSPNALLDKHAVDIVKQMQQLRDIDDADYDNNTKSGPDRVGRRKTIHKLAKEAQRKRQIGSLDEAFERRFFKVNPNDQNSGTRMLKRITMTKETINAFEKRRNTVIEERRKSQMHTFGANSDYGMLSAGVSQRNSIAMSDTRGQLNAAFEDDEDANSIEMQPMNNWNNNNS